MVEQVFREDLGYVQEGREGQLRYEDLEQEEDNKLKDLNVSSVVELILLVEDVGLFISLVANAIIHTIIVFKFVIFVLFVLVNMEYILFCKVDHRLVSKGFR